MTTQPEALRLADALDSLAKYQLELGGDGKEDKAAAAELRRLHAVNAGLLEALQLALSAHGRMLMSDPPQDAWKAYRVEEKARAAIDKAEEVKP